MRTLKLAKLPERAPVRLTIAVQPDLHRALSEYADTYRETYGDTESVADLVPYMLQAFIESDRDFSRAGRARRSGPASPG